MHVLYDHQTFCLQKYGGVSRYFLELIRHIAEEDGVQASLFAGFNIDRYGIDSLKPKLHAYYSCRRPFIPYTAHLFNSLNRIPLKLFLLGIDAVDIYHPTYFLPISRVSASTRMVLTVHDMTHEKLPEAFARRDRTAILKARAVKMADAIICDSQSTKRDLVEILRVPESKCTVVYLGSSLSPVTAGSQLDTPYYLFVGPRDRYKNFWLAAEAFALHASKIPDTQLVCFGGGCFSDRDLRRIDKLGIGKKVQWIGGGDKTAARLYQHALALLYPSLSEGFGLPPLEAMSLGCPAVVCRLTSVPEVVGEAGIYVDPKHPEHLATVLNQLYENSGHRNELIAAGRIQAAKFSWRRMAQETVEVYRTCGMGNI